MEGVRGGREPPPVRPSSNVLNVLSTKCLKYSKVRLILPETRHEDTIITRHVVVRRRTSSYVDVRSPSRLAPLLCGNVIGRGLGEWLSKSVSLSGPVIPAKFMALLPKLITELVCKNLHVLMHARADIMLLHT